jgi:hypothetical protein
MQAPEEPDFSGVDEGFVRLSISNTAQTPSTFQNEDASMQSDSESDEDEEADEELWLPELRLVRKSDPEAYNFSTQQYSAHKLPKDVVDASQSGEGLREFARDWQNILEQRKQEDAELSD